jgi:transcriptional regulator with XRE-family HTH domain
MEITQTSVEAREVVRCKFSDCRLVQFRPSNSHCLKCHRPLEVEEPVRLGPVPVALHTADPSTEAGLKVAGQVKEIRRARHLSQRQLAGRMQVPRTYISKIENGKAIPTLGSLERLATALGVDICQLVRDSHSHREEEVKQVMSDSFLAEIATLLPSLDSLQRSMLLNEVRERARERSRDQVRDIALGRRRTA